MVIEIILDAAEIVAKAGLVSEYIASRNHADDNAPNFEKKSINKYDYELIDEYVHEAYSLLAVVYDRYLNDTNIKGTEMRYSLCLPMFGNTSYTPEIIKHDAVMYAANFLLYKWYLTVGGEDPNKYKESVANIESRIKTQLNSRKAPERIMI